jgi:hypothetical protein
MNQWPSWTVSRAFVWNALNSIGLFNLLVFVRHKVLFSVLTVEKIDYSLGLIATCPDLIKQLKKGTTTLISLLTC